MRHVVTPASSRGEGLLLEFRDHLSDQALRTLLARFGPDDDVASRILRETTGTGLDLADAEHRHALLTWLRSWGCRHLRRADEARSSAALRRWWRRYADALPPRRRALTDLTHRDLERIEPAYTALASLPVASRASTSGDVDVTFGDTAAAKALFAMRPHAFPPWDEPIRRSFGTARADGALYRRYVEADADAIRGASARLGIAPPDLPARLGRAASTSAKLIDEYLWLRATRGASP
jgi:hypothetical protein